MPPEPSIRGLAPSHARAARAIATRLRSAGHRAWVVGGAVRDLALGRVPKDVDMVSAARPEQVEALFARTVGVGRAFGILRVLVDGAEVEVATFRTEAGYSDGRRPDEVRYGTSLEEDAERRDFTCNALYLDPLEDEVRDPFSGRADLDAGLLRAVGDAQRRFGEDGLRLLRMARFEATLELEPAPGLHAAARASAAALRGVSPERVLSELTALFEAPGAARGLRAIFGCELAPFALPEWHAALPPAGDGRAARLGALEALPAPPGAPLGLAVLLEPDPLGGWDAPCAERAERQALALRASRRLLQTLRALWSARRELPDLALPGADPAHRARVLREPEGPDALRLARAWALAAGRDPQPMEDLENWLADQTEATLRPRPLLRPPDLVSAGLEPGPRFGALLRAAEDEQLRGRLASREQALEWLGRASAGGKDAPEGEAERESGER